MTLPALDIVVIVLYLAGIVGLGAYFVRTSRSTSGFMVAGGALPGWAVGLSIFGTFLSSNTFLGNPGKAYGTNWNALVFSFSLPIAAWLAVRYFVPFYRNRHGVSAYEHLEQRFGPWARTYGVLCYLLIQLARMGAILFGVSLVISPLTGWPQTYIIVGAGVLVTLYTALGGIEAVIWTDVVQSLVLGAGALVILGLLLFGMPEGPTQAIQIAAQQNKFSLGSFKLDFRAEDVRGIAVVTLWVPLLYGLFENLKNFGIDQSYVQRYHASRTARQAARSVWLGALLYLPISVVFFAIGSSAYAYYQTHPEMLADVKQQAATEKLEADRKLNPAAPPITEAAVAAEAATLSDADVGDNVLPHFIVHRLPAGGTGLLVAAIFAAAMSSVDTSLNSSATVVLLDIYKRRLRPACGEREAMIVLYAATAAMGAAGVSMAVAMLGVKSVLDAWWTLSGVFAGGLLGLFLLGMLSRRAGSGAALCGVIAGVATILWMSLPDAAFIPEWLRNPLHRHMTIVVGTLTIFFVGLIASRWDLGQTQSPRTHTL